MYRNNVWGEIVKDTFSKNIKNLRKEQGLSQTELADKIFINKSMVSAYEKGTRMPSLGALIQLSNVLNVSIDYLLGIQKENTNDRASTISISGLTEKQKKIVSELIETFREQN